MKKTSELIEEIAVTHYKLPSKKAFVDLEAYDRMKQLAVALARACETGAFHHQACDSNWYSEEVDEEKVRAGVPDPRKAKHCTCARIKIEQALASCRKILEGDE